MIESFLLTVVIWKYKQKPKRMKIMNETTKKSQKEGKT